MKYIITVRLLLPVTLARKHSHVHQDFEDLEEDQISLIQLNRQVQKQQRAVESQIQNDITGPTSLSHKTRILEHEANLKKLHADITRQHADLAQDFYEEVVKNDDPSLLQLHQNDEVLDQHGIVVDYLLDETPAPSPDKGDDFLWLSPSPYFSDSSSSDDPYFSHPTSSEDANLLQMHQHLHKQSIPPQDSTLQDDASPPSHKIRIMEHKANVAKLHQDITRQHADLARDHSTALHLNLGIHPAPEEKDV